VELGRWDEYRGVAEMMHLVRDPRLFNCLLLFLNLCSAVRWAYAGRWWNALYWIAAFTLTFVITFGRKIT
jgi:hypothetical protein